MRSFTWDDVRARRLARSHLLRAAPADRIVEVARDVGGIHAQVTAADERAYTDYAGSEQHTQRQPPAKLARRRPHGRVSRSHGLWAAVLV